MNSKELIIEILKDIIIVERKSCYLGMGLRREAIKSKGKHVHRVFDYRSKQYNNWIITIDCYVNGHNLSLAAYYIDQFGINGIRVHPDHNSIAHYTSHFLERYNERFLRHENLSKIDLFKRFIQMNPLEVTKLIPDTETIQNRIFGKFAEGVGLGYKERLDEIGKALCQFKTFISNDMIRESQMDDFESAGNLFEAYIVGKPKINLRRA